MAIAVTGAGDAYFSGVVYCQGFVLLPGGSSLLTDAFIAASAGIKATKLQQQREPLVSISNYGSAPAAVRRTIRRINGATGTVTKISAGVTQALTAGSVTVDVLKNGTSILSSAITLNTTPGTGGTAGDVVNGVISTPGLVAGDKLEMNVTVSAPTGGGGCDCQVIFTEDPA